MINELQLELLKEFDAFTYGDSSVPNLFDKEVLEKFKSSCAEDLHANLSGKDLFDKVVAILNERTVVQKESETCSKIVEPLLELLGFREANGAKRWLFDEQRNFQQDGEIYIPDYCVFGTHSELASANENAETYYSKVRLLVEAKRVDSDLLKKQRVDRRLDDRGVDSISAITPLSQIRRYVRTSNVPYGILTNGIDWILVARNSQSELSTYHVKLDALIEFARATGNYEILDHWWIPFSKHFILDAESNRISAVIRDSESATHSLEDDLKERLAPAVIDLLNLQYRASKNQRAFLQKQEEHIIGCVRFIYVLLYVGCLEDRNLLPVNNPIYRYRYSLKNLFSVLQENQEWVDSGAKSFLLYEQLKRLVRLVQGGCIGLNKKTSIQGSDVAHSESFSIPDSLRIPDQQLAPLLLRILASPKNAKLIASLRSLDTIQFGNIYEHILKIEIKLDAREKCFVFGGEDSDSLEKSTAVYTPNHIVTDMVRTVVNGIEIESWDKISKIRMVDPCFGSGHFLIEFSRQLAQKVVDTLEEDKVPLKGYTARIGIERRILVQRYLLANCIFGVDRSRACSYVAKFAMWLSTALPGESPIFLELQLGTGNSLFGKDLEAFRNAGTVVRKTLGKIAKARNRLRKQWSESGVGKFQRHFENHQKLVEKETRALGPAFFRELSGQTLLGISKELLDTVQNPFIWWKEFPEVFFGGGFDILITNPPYDQLKRSKSTVKFEEAIHSQYRLGKTTDLDLDIMKDFFRKDPSYKEALVKNVGQARYTDVYEGFLLLKRKILKTSGYYSMIVPNGILAGPSTQQVRKELWKDKVIRIQEFPEKDSVGRRVFRDRKVACAIICGAHHGNFDWTGSGHQMSFQVYNDANDLSNFVSGALSLELSREIDEFDVPFVLLDKWQKIILTQLDKFKLSKIDPSVIKEGDLKESMNEQVISTTPKKNWEEIYGNNRLTEFCFNFWPKQGDVNYCDRKNSRLSDAKYQDYKKARIVFKGISGRNDSRILCASYLPPETLLNNNVDYVLIDDLRSAGLNEQYYLSLINSTVYDRYARIKKKKDHNGSELVSQLMIPAPDDSAVDPKVVSAKLKWTVSDVVKKLSDKCVLTSSCAFALSQMAAGLLETNIYRNSFVYDFLIFIEGFCEFPIALKYQAARKIVDSTLNIDELNFELGLRGRKAVEVKEAWNSAFESLAILGSIKEDYETLLHHIVALSVFGDEEQAKSFNAEYGFKEVPKRSIGQLEDALKSVADTPDFEIIEAMNKWLAS